VAALEAMMMGLRSSEIITRTVRDLDDGGRTLWVDDTEDGFQPKTEAGRRPVDVPPELQPLLLKRCKDKLPGALLLPGAGGDQHDRGWPRKAVRRLCKKVEIPPVCAHALRGLYATLTIRSGVDPRAVARALGHESVRTTLRSYAAPGSERAAQGELALEALRGVRK
jgi:integrase